MLSSPTTEAQADKVRQKSPFERVYGANPLAPMDLAPFTVLTKYSHEANQRVEEIKKLHEKGKAELQKANEKLKEKIDKKQKKTQYNTRKET